METGEKAQPLRALAVHPLDLSSVPSIHEAHSTSDFNPWGSNTLFCLLWALPSCGIHTYMHVGKTSMYIQIKKK